MHLYFFLLSSHPHLGYPQRGLSIAHGNSLAVLTTGPDPKAEVIAYPIDLFQDLRSIANKHRSPDRFSHPSFLEKISLADLKDEISINGIDLSPAHFLHE